MQLFRLLLLAIAALAAAPAGADPVADFYRGKQIKIYIRAAPGGNYDVYSRLIGRHIVRFLPGSPSVLPINMPGGGGLVALNYVANVAPRDGTVLTMITQSFPMDQALGLDKNLKVDLRSLNWIGNMSDTGTIFFTAKSSPTRTLDDARRRETIVAATGVGSIMTQLAAVYNNMLGTRFKVIYGYPSGPDMSLAMERGEVEGRSNQPHGRRGAHRHHPRHARCAARGSRQDRQGDRDQIGRARQGDQAGRRGGVERILDLRPAGGAPRLGGRSLIITMGNNEGELRGRPHRFHAVGSSWPVSSPVLAC